MLLLFVVKLGFSRCRKITRRIEDKKCSEDYVVAFVYKLIALVGNNVTVIMKNVAIRLSLKYLIA